MAVYGISHYGTTTYGEASFIELRANNFTARPEGYTGLFLSWDLPSGTWETLRLVRSSFGFPTTVNDGTTLFEDDLADARTTYVDGLDVSLHQGRFYYYTLFVYVTSSSAYQAVGRTMELVTQDYESGERMFALLPQVHRDRDADHGAQLERFLGLFGYQFDRLRTEGTTLLNTYQIDLVSGGLLPVLAQMFGIDDEPELGQRTTRTILKNAVYLAKIKGTKPGIEGVVSAWTGWGATVSIGPNIMLTYNDSGAVEGLGRGTVTGATLAHLTEVAFTPPVVGVGTTQVTGTGAGAVTINFGSFATTDLIRVNESTAYVFSAYVKKHASSTARSVGLNILWYDAAGTLLGTTTGATANDTDAWVRRNVTATSPADTVWARPVYTVAATANTEVRYLSALQFEAGSTPTAYESARRINIYIDPERANLVTNPSFEVNTTGWVDAGNFTLARVADASSFSGDYVLRLTASAATASAAQTSSGTSGFVVTEGTYYTGFFYMKPDSVARQGQAILKWYDAAGVYLSASSGSLTLEVLGEWTRAYVTALAPADAAFGALTANYPTMGAGEVRYLDGAMVEETEFLRDYFDASLTPTTDYLWSGTTHQSVSNYYPRREIKDYRLRTVLPKYVPAGTTYETFYGATAPASSV